MNILIYTTTSCPYCIMAKNLLKNNNLKYKEISVEGKLDELQILIKKTNHKTIPQIFIENKFIGGYNELKIFIAKFSQNNK